jgi:hypothetical protein
MTSVRHFRLSLWLRMNALDRVAELHVSAINRCTGWVGHDCHRLRSRRSGSIVLHGNNRTRAQLGLERRRSSVAGGRRRSVVSYSELRRG